ncbi:MAG: DNA repair protein RadA [Chitinophagales bacterium]
MVRNKTVFVCQECGYGQPKWTGKCPGCGSWNSLVEEIRVDLTDSPSTPTAAYTLADLPIENSVRISSGIQELDRVLGGGIVPGSLILLGGDPGIGKSTLLLQVAENMSTHKNKVLYLSGEESPRQIKSRASRLGITGTEVYMLNEPDLGLLNNYIEKIDPNVIIIDSIQTVFVKELGSVPGSISQLRECTSRLMGIAKGSGRTIFLVGHVTKEGMLAGPKVLEHMVDTVIYFEGDSNNYYRILRTVKNRYGSVNEIGVMEMSESGLLEVPNPSQVFLGDSSGLPGSSVTASFEGTRALLIEVESLVVATSFGYPRRMATGLDINRLALIAAVLEKRGSLTLSNKDIYLKAAGGAVLKDPATDLGVAAAILSSYLERQIPAGSVIIGELGLSGEVRTVPYLDVRLKEAEKMGFNRALVPAGSWKDKKSTTGMEIFEASNLNALISYIE